MYWVYVLINHTAGNRYIGQTNNLKRRLEEHNGTNQNPHRFTSKYPGTWELLYSESYLTRAEAMSKEKWFFMIKTKATDD